MEKILLLTMAIVKLISLCLGARQLTSTLIF